MRNIRIESGGVVAHVPLPVTIDAGENMRLGRGFGGIPTVDTRYPARSIGLLFNKTPHINDAAVAAVPPDVIPVVCFKGMEDDATLIPAMDWATPGREMWVCPWQEPEGDEPTTLYAQQMDALVKARDAHDNADRILVIAKLTLYAQTHGKGPWTSWLTGGEDLLCVDAYFTDPPEKGDYPDPKTFFAPVLAAADAAGLSFAITELGARRRANDPLGLRLAAWISACVAYLRSVGCVAVLYWDGIGTQFEYTLTGTALAVYQALVENQ